MLKTGRDPRGRLLLSAKALTNLFSRLVSAFVVFGRRAAGAFGFRAGISTVRCKQAVLVIAGLLVSLTVLIPVLQSAPAQAATSTTITFQGRLLTSTGTTVPDGSYNMQFNLYTVASGGSTQWTDSRLVNATQGITLKNGYFSVNLADTSVGGTAFPSTINWDQEQWLGLTVRGTNSCTPFSSCATPADAEMTPRFKLTSVPFAKSAAQLQNTSGSFTSTVNLTTPTANRVILFPDAGGTAVLQTSTFTTNGVVYANANSTAVSTAAGTTGQCLVATGAAAPSWGSCAGSGSGVTLQAAYDNSTTPATITTADAKNILFTLSNTATDPNFLVNIATSSTSKFAVQNNGTDVLSVVSAGATLTGTLAVTGSATINLNAGANTTAIGTGTTTGAITVGGGANTFALNSTNIDISNTGAITGATGIATTGNFAHSGAGTFGTGTGAVSINGNTTIASGKTLDVTPTGAGKVTITNTTASSTNGTLDLQVTSSSNFVPSLNIATTQTATGTLNAAYGINNNFSSSAVVAGAGTNQTLYGIYNSISKSGADTATGTATTYGTYDAVSNTGRTNVGTVNTYGGYFSSLGDTNGTSTTYGLYTTASGADLNYGIYSAAGTNYFAGLVQGALGLTVSGAAVSINDTSNFAVNISTGTTNTLTTIGGGSGTFSLQTTNIDISNTGAISGATSITASGLIQGGTGAFTATGSLTLGTASSDSGQVLFRQAASANTVTLQAPVAAIAGNFTLSIPTIAANDTLCLATLSNCTAVGAAGGALTGTYPSPTLTGLTVQGAVPFQSASSGVLASDATNLFFDNTGKRLGVGTATVGTNRLTVNNAATTDNIFVAQDGGVAVFTIGDGGVLTATNAGANAVNLGAAGTLSVVSSLTSGNRSSTLLALSQANDATFSNSANLLNVTSLDTNSTGPLVIFSNSSTASTALQVGGAGTSNSTPTLLLTQSTGWGIAWGGNNGFGLGGIVVPANYYGGGSSIAIGSGSLIGANYSTAVNAYTGKQLSIDSTRTGASSTLNDTGQFVYVNRVEVVNGVGQTLTTSGDLAVLQSNCTVSAGTCTDTSNILELNQQYASASGDVLNVLGAGTGNLATLDASNASANGVLVDIQSNSTQYALRITGNNGANNALEVTGAGNVNLGTSTSTVTVDNALTVTGATTLNGNLTVGDAVTDTATFNATALANNAASGGTIATTGTGGINTTTITLASTGFANGDIIFVDNTGGGGQDYYTRITAGGGTASLTVDQPISYGTTAGYTGNANITKYNIQNIGAVNTGTTFADSARFFQGFFLGGVRTGSGSTTLSDQNLTSTQALYLNTGGNNTRLYVSSTGNVGIGTTSPGANFQLDVRKNQAGYTYINVDNSNAPAAGTGEGYSISENGTTTAALRYERDATGILNLINVGGSFDIKTDATTFASATTKLRVNNAGNVSIGNTNNTYKLDVSGDVNISTGSVFRVNGTAGASTTCSGGQILQNQVTVGGITTGGTCSAAGSGTVTGTGATTQLAFWTAASALSGNANFVFDTTNNRLAVGTATTTDAGLTVTSTGSTSWTVGGWNKTLKLGVDGSHATIRFPYNASTQFGLGVTTDGIFRLIRSDNTTAGGSVSYDLTVSTTGAITANTSLTVSDAGKAAGVALLAAGDDTFFTDVDVAHTLGLYSASDTTRGSLRFGSAGPTLDGTSGLLSINTALSVGGSITVPNTSQLTFGSNVSDKINLYSTTYGLGVSGSDFQSYSNGQWSFRQSGYNGTTVASISNGGIGYLYGGDLYVQAGSNYTRVHNNGSHGYIDVTGTGANLYLRPTNATITTQGFYGNYVAATTFASPTLYNTWAACTSGADGQGNYQIGRCNPSSARYKNTINTYGAVDGLEKLRQLRPVTYFYNPGLSADSSGLQSGFIAEEVAAIDPLFAVYENGVVESVKYDKIAVLLTAGIKQLDVQVQSMDARLAVIEAGTFSGNLSVAGYAQITGSLTVTGDTTLTKLTVTGDTQVQNITVNGKIITSGTAPTATVGAVSGASAAVTVAGNDTAGNINYSTGTVSLPTNPVAAGEQISAVFASAYTAPPRIAVTAKNDKAASVRYYVETSATGFVLKFIDAPDPSAQYVFDYIIIQ